MMTSNVTEISEQQIQNQIMDYLRLKGYFFWRNNTGGMIDKQNHFYRFGKKGSGDILGLTKQGRMFSVEVKRRGKKPSPDQEQFMSDVNMSGGLAFVANCLEDVQAQGL